MLYDTVIRSPYHIAGSAEIMAKGMHAKPTITIVSLDIHAKIKCTRSLLGSQNMTTDSKVNQPAT